MNYYRQLFFNNRFFVYCFLLLEVSFCSSPLLADEVYTVEIQGSPTVTVDWLSLMQEGNGNSPLSSDSNTGITANIGDNGNNLDTGISQSSQNINFDLTPPEPRSLTSGRNAWWVGKTKYINIGTGTRFKTDQQDVSTPMENLNENYSVKEDNWIFYFTGITFNYMTFKNSLLNAIFGAGGVQWLTEIVQTLYNAPSGSDFTLTVPEIFGFNTGFVITVPVYSILTGAGDYYVFYTIFVVIRSFFGFVYYSTAFMYILRVVVYYQ